MTDLPDDSSMTPQNDSSVKDYIASLDEQTAKDSQVLIEMMQRISGHKPKLWNAGTLGIDSYHYKYDSGREGDGHDRSEEHTSELQSPCKLVCRLQLEKIKVK